MTENNIIEFHVGENEYHKKVQITITDENNVRRSFLIEREMAGHMASCIISIVTHLAERPDIRRKPGWGTE